VRLGLDLEVGSVDFGVSARIVDAGRCSCISSVFSFILAACMINVVIGNIGRRKIVVFWTIWVGVGALCSSCSIILGSCSFGSSGLHLCSLFDGSSPVAKLGALMVGSCRVGVALMVVEVAILVDDFVEVVEGIDVGVGGNVVFLVGSAPLLFGWLVLIVIRGSVRRRRMEEVVEW
jgi:hypothetical protein